MFTPDDEAFLERLALRANTSLSSSDPSADRLHAAIRSLRATVTDDAHPCSDDAHAEQVEHISDLLDLIEWSTSAGERQRARHFAALLARAVRGLNLPGSRAMRAVDAAQRIRSLVVLAA